METVKYLFGLIIGLIFLVGAASDVLGKWRRRRHFRRAPGVIVGLRDARGEMGRSPGTHSRAAVFRFTLPDGRVVEAESNVQSFPGPKPGKRVTVLYDPQRPYAAETTGRFAIILVVMPVVMVIGLVIVVISLANLL